MWLTAVDRRVLPFFVFIARKRSAEYIIRDKKKLHKKNIPDFLCSFFFDTVARITDTQRACLSLSSGTRFAFQMIEIFICCWIGQFWCCWPSSVRLLGLNMCHIRYTVGHGQISHSNLKTAGIWVLYRFCNSFFFLFNLEHSNSWISINLIHKIWNQQNPSILVSQFLTIIHFPYGHFHRFSGQNLFHYRLTILPALTRKLCPNFVNCLLNLFLLRRFFFFISCHQNSTAIWKFIHYSKAITCTIQVISSIWLINLNI